MTNNQNLHLLVIEESRSDAESLANELRNAGHKIDLKHATELASMETSLAEQVPDILVCGSGEGLPDAASVKAALDKQHIKTPVIAIADEASEDTVVTARKAGIAALVSYDRPDHMHAVFKHEVEIVKLRHKLETFSDVLQASEKRCHALIENSSDAIAYIHDGMHVYANKPYMDLFDVKSRDDIECMPVLDMISSNQQDVFRNFLKNYSAKTNTDNLLEIDCVSPSGELFNATMEFSPATMDGESCTQIIIRVNTGNNSELEKKIKTLSRKDMLTGLWNRQHFMRMLEEQMEYSGKDGRQRALVYLTLDNFKVIREEAGIASSDLVLRDIAGLLEKERGQHDLLSRFGECVFTMLKQNTDMEELQASCEILLKIISDHLTEIDGRAFTMTASIGICPFDQHSANVQTVISYADMACEVARTSGGNQIHTHSTEVDESIGLDMRHDADQIIRDTLDNERFFLVYQPIVSLKGDTSQHYEVLLRVLDTEQNVIMPGQFLSIAERMGVAAEVDYWVINKAFSTLSEYGKDYNASFYVKISESTMADPASAEWISNKVQEYQLDSKCIVLEIAERCAANNLVHAKTFVTAMRNLGCRIAVEHFGLVDHAQLLKHIEADIIKIDGTLIGQLRNNKDVEKKIRSIIDAARENEIICIAECVDDANLLALLWQNGVDYIQGYFVQEPDKELGYEFESEIV